MLQQIRVDLVVDVDLSGVDNPHVHALGNGVVEECRVHGPTHGLIASEGERDVGHTPRNLGQGQMLLDPRRRLHKVDGIVVMGLDPRSNGQDVGVDDDILRRHANPIDQQSIYPLRDRNTSFIGVGLPCLVEAHDDHGSTMIATDPGTTQELLFAILE